MLLLAGVVLGVRWFFSGPRLAHFLTGVLFDGKIRGRVEVGSVDWPFTAILQRRIPATLTNLKILDGDGELVLLIPRATCVIDWLTAALPKHDVIIDDLRVESGWAFVHEKPGPDPEHPWEASLIAALAPRVPDTRPPEERHDEPGPLIQIRSLHLEHVNVMLIMHGFGVYLQDIETDGVLRQSFEQPQLMDFSFSTAPTAKVGFASFAKMHYIVRDFRANRFGQYPQAKDSLEFSVQATTVEGAFVEAVGHLDHLYDKEPGHSTVTMELDARRGGNLLERLSNHSVAGGHPAAHLEITGPFQNAKMDWSARGLPITLAPLTIDHTVGTLSLYNLDAEFKETELRGLGGRAEMKGKGNLAANVVGPMTVTIDEPMDVAPYLPKAVLRETGGELSGQARLLALGIPPFAYSFDRVHLQLGRLGVHGSAKLAGGIFRTNDLTLTLPDATAMVWGQVDLYGKKISVDGKASAARLETVLARLGLPALAKSMEVPRAEVRGTFERPVITADAVVLGVPMVPQLATSVTYAHAPGAGRLDVHKLEANPFGGSVSGKGTIQLGARPRLDGVKLDATKLDLGRLPAVKGLVNGSADLHLAASGPLLSPAGNLDVDLGDLRFAGHALDRAEAHLVFDERKGILVKRFHIGDRAGSLDVTGSFGLEAPRPLDLHVQLASAPLSLLPAPSLTLGGTASADLRLGGSLDRPTAAGRIGVVGLALWDALLGSGQITFDVQRNGRVHFAGRLFHDRLTVDGTVAIHDYNKVDLQARVDFDQLELAEIFYDTAKRLGADGWISGWLEVKTQPDLVAELHVERLRFDITSAIAVAGGDERLPLTIQNHGPIVVKYEAAAERATLVGPMRLASPTGELLVEGAASPAQLALHLRGEVQLRLLEPYLRRWLDRATGTLGVDVKVAGTAEKPLLDGNVQVQSASLVPRAQDGELKIPSGQLKLSLTQIDVVGFVLDVDGEKLDLSAKVGLAGLRPSTVDAFLRGRASGRLLQMLAPQQVTHASGSARLEVAMHGDVANPRLTGALEIDRPLEIAPRALRRDVILRSGHAEIDGAIAIIDPKNPIRGTIDEGTFSLSGRAQIAPLKVAVHADVYGLVHKVPDMLSVELGASVDANLADDQLSLSGHIDIIDGRYFAQIHYGQVVQGLVFGKRTEVETEPFWKGSPLLENMTLHLDVETKADSFSINNSIAHNVRLAGSMTITGTPPAPHFDGEVSASSDGTLSVPFISRIREFAVTDGKVSFSASRHFPDETPSVLLHADAPFVDAAGVEHRVFLELTGNLQNLDWNLRTSTGLNKVETLSLITTGRTPDELRAQARGDATRASSAATTNPALAATVSPGSSSAIAAATDELIQAVTADFISSLLQDPLRSGTGFDITFSFGSDSVRANVHKALGAILDLSGDYERAPTWYRLSANLNLRAADDLTLTFQYWIFKPPEEAEGTQNAFRLQLKYHLIIP